MKYIYAIAIAGLLIIMTIPTPAKAWPDNSIHGYVKIYGSGTPVEDLEIEAENLDTSESIYVETDEFGAYLVDLDEFTSWSTGDYIHLKPAAVGGYASCNPVIQLSSNVDGYCYGFDLWLTFIPAGTSVVKGASPHLTNNEEIPSGVIWQDLATNGNKVIGSNDVTVTLHPCYTDDGYKDVPYQGSMNVNYDFTLYYRHNGDNDWNIQDNSYISDYYTVSYHTYTSGNPTPNPYLSIDNADALFYTWDFKVKITCSDNGGNWDTGDDYIVTNFDFTYA